MSTLEPKTIVTAADPTKFVTGAVPYGADGVPYDDTVSAPVVQPKSATITPAQFSVGTAVAQLFSVNPSAADRLISCTTADIFIGGPAVTATTGFRIQKDMAPVRLPASVGEIYAITASGTATVYVMEQ